MAKAAKRERQKENRERAREERERMLKRQRRNRTLRSLAFVLVPIVVIMVIISLVSSNDDEKSASSSSSFDASKGYTATIETSRGDIVVALDAKSAPKATKHFVQLADDGFYDNTCIDRIARDFVIQGGSENCDGNTGSGTTIVGEVPKDNYPVGSVAAAKTGSDPAGTMDSIFFIVTGSQGATLPNDYARFGNVIQGQDVADQIAQLPIENNANDGKPTDKIAIKKVTVKVTDSPATTTSTTAGK